MTRTSSMKLKQSFAGAALLLAVTAAAAPRLGAQPAFPHREWRVVMRDEAGTTVSMDSAAISRTGDGIFMVRTATHFPERLELENGLGFTGEVDVEELNCGADSIRGYVSQLYADTMLVRLVPLASTWEPVPESRRPVFAASCEYLRSSFAAALPRSYATDAVEQGPQLANRRAASDALSREYPPAQRAAGRRGRVLLRFRITERGAVDLASISLVSFSDPAFAEAAIRVVGSLRFRPARLNGEGVPVWVMLPMTFELQNADPFGDAGPGAPLPRQPRPEIPPSMRPE
jgi:TonB family protein